MKRLLISLSLCASLAAISPLCSQTLDVVCGNVDYHFDASQTGKMLFNSGSELTILDKTFQISDISNITTTADPIADNCVSVIFDNSSAKATVAGNIARYVDVSIEGAHVVITQSSEVADDTCGEITYALSGASSYGEFTLNAAYKASVELNGLTLTNPAGAAIDIQNGKRTAIRVKENTVNTLTDGASGSQKAALYCKGHLEFKQNGILNVTGNKAHAISAK